MVRMSFEYLTWSLPKVDFQADFLTNQTNKVIEKLVSMARAGAGL